MGRYAEWHCEGCGRRRMQYARVERETRRVPAARRVVQHGTETGPHGEAVHVTRQWWQPGTEVGVEYFRQVWTCRACGWEKAFEWERGASVGRAAAVMTTAR